MTILTVTDIPVHRIILPIKPIPNVKKAVLLNLENKCYFERGKEIQSTVKIQTNKQTKQYIPDESHKIPSQNC